MINDDLFFIESSGATGKVSHSDTVVTTAAIIWLEFWPSFALSPQKPKAYSVGTGAQDGHLDFQTVSKVK